MKLTKVAHPAGAPPPEPEHLPCPRCESTNTKFCYYNNYNFSQPRHFCKGCRRYWTHGGTLRDIPVGGGTRKRHRPSSAADPPPVSAVSPPVVFGRDVVNVSGSGNINNNNNNSIKHGFNYGSFTSLLGSNGPVFNGFGPGFVNPMWPFQMGGNGPVMGDTWQMQSGGEGGYMGLGVGGGECYTLPELAISTPGYCLK